jgi:leucyl/phenylalanyl-tRNA--protein transferase
MRGRPVEPPATGWSFPELRGIDADDLIAIGADLAPGTVLAAYRAGLFPMYVQRRRLGWWSPNPRGIIPLDGLRVSRSTARSARRFELRSNTSFEAVMHACADPHRPHGWITRDFVATYTELHHLGWAHSVETWREGRLVGGLYGVAIGGLFAGESMFHRETDASKVALIGLVERLRARGYQLLDVQWITDHLASLGAVPIRRDDYLGRLGDAVGAKVTWEGPWEP